MDLILYWAGFRESVCWRGGWGINHREVPTKLAGRTTRQIVHGGSETGLKPTPQAVAEGSFLVTHTGNIFENRFYDLLSVSRPTIFLPLLLGVSGGVIAFQKRGRVIDLRVCRRT